jgi:hypothetical protein
LDFQLNFLNETLHSGTRDVEDRNAKTKIQEIKTKREENK